MQGFQHRVHVIGDKNENFHEHSTNVDTNWQWMQIYMQPFISHEQPLRINKMPNKLLHLKYGPYKGMHIKGRPFPQRVSKQVKVIKCSVLKSIINKRISIML